MGQTRRSTITTLMVVRRIRRNRNGWDIYYEPSRRQEGLDLYIQHGAVHEKGRSMGRTWSLLSAPLNAGDSFISVRNDPISMGWKVGDPIAIAPTDNLSQGERAGNHIHRISEVLNESSAFTFTYCMIARLVFSRTTPSISRSSVEIKRRRLYSSRNIELTRRYRVEPMRLILAISNKQFNL
jgi:hypothetical protein